MDITEARKALQKLIEVYEKHKDDKKYAGNEKQVCQSLIVPLIKNILHWNTEDPSEFWAEESQGGKRIDYVVYNQGISQFIVEAKAPSHDIFDNEGYYTQALEYGYGKEHDFALLTNFKQVVILGCRIQFRVPREAELEKFDLINATDEQLRLLLAFEKGYWNSSGKDNLLYSKLTKHKRTIPVDEQLLEDMKHWREQLLRNIRENSRHNQYDFDDEQEFMKVEEEVQKFIDRLIFICYCEDKELHEPHLKRLMNDKKERFDLKPGYLLSKIQELFAEYRRIYDSDLFDKTDCDTFKIDDDKILEVIEQLREPKGRAAYNFASIEADILGKTYENFIGHIQTGKKRFKEKEDIGKRKKEGIYYTPKYIVDYIVNNTVREYVKGKSFAEIKKVRILDPACGSGSFLRRAFDVLVEESQRSLKKQLTYEEKKELLLGCIYGVDIDERARAIARLNLSLKLAERDKPLPMLGENIRLGNSLIDDKEIAGYKHFIWEEEFKEIMDKGGFDVVVGNPPWGADIDDILVYLREKYPHSTQEHKDIYKCFIEKAVTLLKSGGILGFIIPNTCLFQPRYRDIRLFLKQYKLLKIVNLGEKVFEGVEAPSCIIIVQKSKTKNNNVKIIDLADSKENEYKAKVLNSLKYIELPQSVYEKTVDNNFVTFYRELDKDEKLLEEVMDCKDCGIKYQRVAVGMKEKGKNDLFERLFYEGEQKNKQDKKYIIGKDLNRYFIDLKQNRWMKYNYKTILKNNEIVYFNENYFNVEEKILWRQTADRPICSLSGPYWFANTLQVGVVKMEYGGKINIKYVLALLNSTYLSYLYIQSVRELGRVFPQVKLNKIKQLPIKIISEPQQQPLINLVDRMLSLNKRLHELKDKSTDEKAKIEAEIKKTDKEIDELVYKLYGITEEEKKLIKDAIK